MHITWSDKIIHILKTDMVQIQATPIEIWQLDIPWFKEQLGILQGTTNGISAPTIYLHYPSITVGGAVLAKSVVIINGYTVTFEDGQYAVNLTGANNNLSDVLNVNQVSVRTSNSAGLQNLSFFESSTYESVVNLDQLNGTSGTLYPAGTKTKPVNNWADARTICTNQNINQILILGSANTYINDDVSNIQIVGTNVLSSHLNIDNATISSNTYLKDLYFTGFLDTNSIIKDCIIGNMTYVSGYIENCTLTENTIALHGSGAIMNCNSGNTTNIVPIIDLSNTTNLNIQSYSGNIKLINSNNNVNVSINMTGKLIVDSSINSGQYEVYGDCEVINNSTGTALVEDKTTGTVDEITQSVWSYITRELTAQVGLTPAQEAKLNQIVLDTSSIPLDVWTHANRELTNIQSDIRFVNGVAVQSINDFKVDVSTLAQESTVNLVKSLVESLPNSQNIADEFVNVNFGKLEIINNQMKVYAQDGALLVTYNLFDNQGNPTMNQVFKREVV